MKDITGIYAIRNKISEKIYIGQSIHIYNRLEKHKYDLINKKHDNRHLQFAWNKYGEEAFEFQVVCECEKEKLNELEQYYILAFETYIDTFGYNISLGGQSSPMREETKNKISNSLKGELNPFYGKTHSEEQKQKWRESRKGVNGPAYGRTGEKHPMYNKHHTEEAKKRISEALKGNTYQKTGEDNPNSKIIYCIELDKKFYGIKNAGRELGIAPQSITACVNKRRKSAGKDKNGNSLHWVYYEEYINQHVNSEVSQ